MPAEFLTLQICLNCVLFLIIILEHHIMKKKNTNKCFFSKVLYKKYLRENKILLSPSFFILFMSDSDDRLTDKIMLF